MDETFRILLRKEDGVKEHRVMGADLLAEPQRPQVQASGSARQAWKSDCKKG